VEERVLYVRFAPSVRATLMKLAIPAVQPARERDILKHPANDATKPAKSIDDF
jgi:hypothetical protein